MDLSAHEMVGGRLDGKKIKLPCPVGDKSTPPDHQYMNLRGVTKLATLGNEAIVGEDFDVQLYKHEVRDDGTHTYTEVG